MRCTYYEAERCRSCALIEVPYPRQLAGKQAAAAEAVPGAHWEEPARSAESGFRNKAKMVVAGTLDHPTLGILDPAGSGIDLTGCPLYEPAVAAALPALRDFARLARLTPYSVPDRRGELKHVLVTGSPDGELMVRFVLRSTEAIARLRKHLPDLLELAPHAVVVSANIQPAHAAVLESDTEIALTENQVLTMKVNGIALRLRPGGFFQTNTAVAAALYRSAGTWADQLAPRSVTDLYCGVGGFALHLARPSRTITGVEVSAAAVAAAREGAARLGADVRFVVADATGGVAPQSLDADLVVVNPPRRGIGSLAQALNDSDAKAVLYSSCNPASLARDLAAMPSLRAVRAQLFDMFPQNRHSELLVLLIRAGQSVAQ